MTIISKPPDASSPFPTISIATISASTLASIASNASFRVRQPKARTALTPISDVTTSGTPSVADDRTTAARMRMASGPRLRRKGDTSSVWSTTSAPEAARSLNSACDPSTISLSPAFSRVSARSGPGGFPNRVSPRTVTAWRDR